MRASSTLRPRLRGRRGRVPGRRPGAGRRRRAGPAEVSTARTANRRIRLLALCFAGAFAVALARAVWIQGVQAGSLDRLAASQQTETVTLPARRGSILDERGLELAVGQQRTTV